MKVEKSTEKNWNKNNMVWREKNEIHFLQNDIRDSSL